MRRKGGKLKPVVNVSIFPWATLFFCGVGDSRNSVQICEGPAGRRLTEVKAALYTSSGNACWDSNRKADWEMGWISCGHRKAGLELCETAF